MVSLRNGMKRLKTGSVLLGVLLSVTMSLYPAPAVQAASEINVTYHTKKEIVDYLEAHPVKNLTASYNVDPSITSPYVIGEMKQEVLEDALTQFNNVRFVAGISHDVSLDATYTQKAQAGSMLNAANSELSHSPSQPADMPNDIYQLGASGAGSSNIAMGYPTLASAVLDAWMEDSDNYNIDRLGHRRWVLNPGMKKTGFGDTVGKYVYGNYTWTMHYQAMYAFDNSFTRTGEVSAWPAQVMPIEYFSSVSAWSYSTGSSSENINNVKVTLTNETRGGTWNFSSSSSDDGYFNVDTANYGLPGCIIFRPNDYQNLYQAGDTFKVTITGLTGGNVSYHVTFFSLSTPYQVSFDANGGSGSMASSGMLANKASYVLPECTFMAPAGKTFDHWEIGSAVYQPGTTVTVTDDMTVKAMWKSTEEPIVAPVITKQPESIAVQKGASAPFSVTATGEDLTYVWQYKLAGSETWVDWTSKTTASISVAYLKTRDGMKLRCVITGKGGKSVTSDEATLTYVTALTITKQPESIQVARGTSASFSVTATGEGRTYLWQYKLKGSGTWVDWTSKKTASISVAYLKTRDGMTLRCVVTDKGGNSVTSSEATLTYTTPLAITKQPESINVTKGTSAPFSVTATGEGLTYLWQYKLKGSTEWVDWTSKKTASISVAYLKTRDGMLLRCVITDKGGNSLTSSEATLTYTTPLAITKQPESINVTKGTSAPFSVTATGEGLTYLWQYKLVGSTEWVDWTSKKTASITVAYLKTRNGMLLRCVITDKGGNTVTSDEATLTY